MRSGFLLAPNDGSEHGPLRDPRSAPRRDAWLTSAGGGGAGGGWGRPAEPAEWGDTEDAMQLSRGDASPEAEDDAEPPIDDNPHRGVTWISKGTLGAPLATLIERYTKNYPELFPPGVGFPQDKCFQSWDDKNPRTDLKMHTCVFICPVTKERFAAGQWPRQKVLREGEVVETYGKGVVLEEPLDGGGGGATVRVVWYRRKKDAKNAAAARALDCLSLREEVGSYGLCREEPYRSPGEAPPLPPSMPELMEVEEEDGAAAPPAAAVVHNPRGDLVEYYKKLYVTHTERWSLKEYFLSWSDGDRHNPVFTSVFTCPASGERWASGQHGDPKLRVVRAEEGGVPVVWYRNKKAAEVAAAARALDCLNARERGSAAGGDRLCVEGPYLVRADGPRLPLSMPEGGVPGITNWARREQDVVADTEEEIANRSEYRTMRAPEARWC